MFLSPFGQVTCEVIKHREYFSDPEYDFMPSTYVNTTCVERTECDPSFNDNSDRKQVSAIGAEFRTKTDVVFLLDVCY